MWRGPRQHPPSNAGTPHRSRGRRESLRHLRDVVGSRQSSVVVFSRQSSVRVVSLGLSRSRTAGLLRDGLYAQPAILRSLLTRYLMRPVSIRAISSPRSSQVSNSSCGHVTTVATPSAAVFALRRPRLWSDRGTWQTRGQSAARIPRRCWTGSSRLRPESDPEASSPAEIWPSDDRIYCNPEFFRALPNLQLFHPLGHASLLILHPGCHGRGPTAETRLDCRLDCDRTADSTADSADRLRLPTND